MKKRISILLVIAMVISMMTGCSSSKNTPPTDTSVDQAATDTTKDTSAAVTDTPSAEPVTLTFLHHMGEQGKKDGLVALSEAFTTKYPNIKIEVEFVSMDDYINQYKQRVAADNAPDFVNYRPFQAPEIIDAGLIEPLDASIFPDNIDQKCIDSVSMNGNVYAIPFDRGGYGLLYNKNMLDKAGVNPESLNTISGLLEACQKIKDAGMVPLASGYAESWTENLIIEGQTWNLMVKNPSICSDLMTGTTKFTDYPEYQDMITHGFKLVRDYALVDEKTASQQASDQYAQFGRGDAAMMVQGTWAISDIRAAQKAAGNTDSFGFTYYPWSDNVDDNYMVSNADDAFMISQSSKHKKEAMLFAQFCLTPEAGKIWANTSGCISALSGVSADKEDELVPIFADVMDKKAYYFEVNPGFTGQYYQDYDKLYIQGRISNQTPDEVIQAWQESYDNIRATGG